MGADHWRGVLAAEFSCRVRGTEVQLSVLTRGQVLVLVGTKRGAFILESDRARTDWDLRGPLGDGGWSFNDLTFDPVDGTIYAAGHNAWYGTAVWQSADRGVTWTLSSEGLTHGEALPRIRQVWSLVAAHGAVYAGVDPAGLFRSDDRGATWTPLGVRLLDQPTAVTWRPGKAGLCLHSIVPHPTDPSQLWVAIAGGGVLHTADGGATWTPRNPIVRRSAEGDEPGLRVQKLAMAPGETGTLYQKNHLGVYRTSDGGRTWDDVTAGLPARFGFPLAVQTRDPGTLYVIPHVNDGTSRHVPDGRLAVWVSHDRGDHWQPRARGLPEQPVFVQVLRQGMATDSLDPVGVYFGTTSGHLFGSNDQGESWTMLAAHLPEIYAVATAVVG